MSIGSDQLGDVYFESPAAVVSVSGGQSFMVGFKLPEEWARVHGSSNIFMVEETLLEYVDARRENLLERGDAPRHDFSFKQAIRAISLCSQEQASRRDNGGGEPEIL